MKAGDNTDPGKVFQTSVLFLSVFYGVLVIWTVGTVPPIWRKFEQGGFSGDWLFAVMIAFFYVYTWFWSLGLFYRITMDADGRIRFKSLRRTLEVSAKKIYAVEGSRLSGGFGFVRFRMPRESGYLFCHRKDGVMVEIVEGIRKMNPLLRTARI